MTARPALIDTHAHLASHKLADDLENVLSRAAEAGVVQMVAIATTAEDSPLVMEIARSRPGIFAAVGIHPNDVADAAAGDWDAIKALARQPKVVALGETGLDRYWDRAPFALQQEYFDRHLRLGRELDLPVVIHSRDCQADVIESLARLGVPIRGVQHSFTGTWEEAETLLRLGLHISFAGMITFENKTLDPLREVAARVPLDRLLIETDSPYLSPHPFRGKRNEPARVVVTAEAVARVRGISVEEFAAATTANARRLFRLPEIAR
jgi:TatD DNase family protein